MRALLRDIYGPVDVLRIAIVELPVSGPGEVVVRGEAASLNKALDHLLGRPRLSRLGTGLVRAANATQTRTARN